MFTRTVEVTTKPGKVKELSNIINDKVLPILKKQTGFVDETVLASDTDPNQDARDACGTTGEDVGQCTDSGGKHVTCYGVRRV